MLLRFDFANGNKFNDVVQGSEIVTDINLSAVRKPFIGSVAEIPQILIWTFSLFDNVGLLKLIVEE